MDSEIHEVQEEWAGQKDLWATHHVAEGSPKDICLFWEVYPTDLPKIMGLQGIHSPKALCRQAGLTFCVQYGKEGQNKGTVANHLQMSHYHLGLICSWCLKYFTTSSDTMHCYSQLWKPALAGVNNDDDNQEEESNSDDNGEDDFVFS